jgi:hypothetical protein
MMLGIDYSYIGKNILLVLGMIAYPNLRRFVAMEILLR